MTHDMQAAYRTTAAGIRDLPVEEADRDAVARMVHDALADVCDGFADKAPNREWFQLTAEAAEGGGADAHTRIAAGLSQVPTDAERHTWLAERIHDVLADILPGFTSRAPNRAWLKAAGA
jgi:hypothetical protein